MVQIKQEEIKGEKIMQRLNAAILLVFGLCFAAPAQDIYKAANTDSLDLATSWTGGIAPGSGDTAVFSNLTANSTVLGTDLSWLGVVVTNNTAATTIGGANTLTLGSGGIKIG